MSLWTTALRPEKAPIEVLLNHSLVLIVNDCDGWLRNSETIIMSKIASKEMTVIFDAITDN